jgi:peptidoglycan/LPS O-acetylase OafA/YrhL
MIAFDDAREMGRRATVCYGDGLLDIGIGLGLLLIGFAMIFDLGALAVIYPALMFPIARSAKRSITAPRMHHLDFMPEPGTESRARRNRAVIVAALAVLLAIGILALLMSRWIPGHVSENLRAHALIIFGSMLAAFFGVGAWATAAKRLRGYAGVAILFLVCGYWFGMKVPWYFIILGSFVAVCGAVVLSRFIRDYPRFHHRNGRVYQRSL